MRTSGRALVLSVSGIFFGVLIAAVGPTLANQLSRSRSFPSCLGGGNYIQHGTTILITSCDPAVRLMGPLAITVALATGIGGFLLAAICLCITGSLRDW